MRHVRRRPSGHEVVTDVGSPTPGPDLPGRRRVPGSEPARAPGGQPPRRPAPRGGPRLTVRRLSLSPARQPRPPSCCGRQSSCSGGSLSPPPRGTSAVSTPAAPAGQPRGPAPHAQARPAMSRPFSASCSGSVWGGRPHSFFHSVLFRAFAPRPPRFRLGQGREVLA